MKLIFTALLLAFGVFFHSLELSSQALYGHPRRPPDLPNIRYYEDPNGTLHNIPPRLFNRLVANYQYIYGINIGDNILPICDANGRRILVRLIGNRNIRMTRQLAEYHGFHNLNWDNYEQLFHQYSGRNRDRGQ